MKASKATVQRAWEKRLADYVVSMCFLATVLVLNDRFGFGKERLNRFSREFTRAMKDYRGRYDEVALDAMAKHVKQLGIEVDWI